MAATSLSTSTNATTSTSQWANKYRGAVIEDLDPSAAFSVHPDTPVIEAMMRALERDYDHLTVISDTKTLLGYMSVPRLRQLLERKQVQETDPVEKVMQKFQRKGKTYTLITMETPLEELEQFFEVGKNEFAVVTDPARRFVLGVATMEDLKKFVERRPN